MRTFNALKNSIFSLGFQIAILVIGFIVPRQIILVFGSEVNGLSSTITQLLNMINLLQAGMVGAAIFEMFKPIIDKDNKTIAAIYYSSNKHFKKLSSIFFFLSLLIIPFLLVGNHSTISIIEVIISVLILGINGAFIFRYATSYDIIFSAYQQKYILVIGMILEKVVYYLLLACILYFKMHFLLMYLVIFLGSVIRVVYYEIKFAKMYKKTLETYSNITDYKVKNQLYLFGNQIVQQLIEGSAVIVVSSIYGLAYASVYSIYLLVIIMFKTCLITVQNAVAASFGDLVASQNKERTNEVFNIIHFLYIVLGTIFFSTVAVMLLPFISIYTNGLTDINYIANVLAFFCIMYLTSYTLFITYDLYINSAGMFKDVFKKNTIIGGVGLIITIIISFVNFELALIGTALFYFFSALMRHVLLNNRYYIMSNFLALKRIVFMYSYSTLAFVFSLNMNLNVSTWMQWGLKSIMFFFINAIVTLLYIVIFERVMLLEICVFIKGKVKKNEE